MKYTNKQLQEYFNVLDSVALKVTGKLAYLVTKNARKIRDELQEYVQIKNENISKYGEVIDGVMTLTTDNPNYDAFIAEMAEYDDIELELELLKAEPADLYSSTLNAVEIDKLDFMINDEDA